MIAKKLQQHVRLPKRDKWSKPWDFVFAAVGFSIGLGNVWRFPYLCFKNGGGAFLIPYLVFGIFIAIPLVILEIALGQRVRRGLVQSWGAVPVMKGLAFTGFILIVHVCAHYLVILSWTFKYLVKSFQANLPWASCDNDWNTDNCVAPSSVKINKTWSVNDSDVTISNRSNVQAVSAAEEYWNHEVLGISTGITEIGNFRTDLAIYYVILWIGVYLCTFKGIKWSAKVVYVTATLPFILIFVVLVRGMTLDGAADGIGYYLFPDLSKLGEIQVWVEAGTQVFYSYGVGQATLVTLGSYNDFRQDFIRDGVVLGVMNCLTSFISGLAVFSTLGYMAKYQNTTVDQVAHSGPGLAFVAYPSALSLLPAPQLWCVAFFLMLMFLGFDSQFVLQECMSAFLHDNIPQLRKFRYSREMLQAAICVPLCLFGFLMTTEGGIYIFEIYNNYAFAGWSLFFVATCEFIAIGWMFGADRFWHEIETMLGPRRGKLWMKIVWKFVGPATCIAVTIYYLANSKPLTYHGYVYPEWASVIGHMINLSSFVAIPVYATFKIVQTFRKRKRLSKILCKPFENLDDDKTKSNSIDQYLYHESTRLNKNDKLRSSEEDSV